MFSHNTFKYLLSAVSTPGTRVGVSRGRLIRQAVVDKGPESEYGKFYTRSRELGWRSSLTWKGHRPVYHVSAGGDIPKNQRSTHLSGVRYSRS